MEQDGRGRAAVLGAVVDAREHDERRQRRQVKRDGEEQADRGEGTDAGKHADQRAERHAGEAIGEVLGRKGNGQAERQVPGQLHQDWKSQKAKSRYGSLRPYTNTPPANALITSVSSTTSRRRNSRPAAAATGNIAASAGTRPTRGIRKPKSRIDRLIHASGFQLQATGLRAGP